MEIKDRVARFLAHHELLNKNKTLFENAFDEKDPLSCYRLSNIIIEITDDPSRQDYLYLLSIASDGNINQAQMILANYYLDKERYEEAYPVFVKMANNENQPEKIQNWALEKACFLLYDGKVQEQNDSFVYQGFEKVYNYDRRNKPVLYALIDMTLHGKGTAKDIEKARAYFKTYEDLHQQTLNVLYKDPKNLKEEL